MIDLPVRVFGVAIVALLGGAALAAMAAEALLDYGAGASHAARPSSP